MMTMLLTAVTVALTVGIGAWTGAQSPAFEVASIKANRVTGGGFTTFGVRPGGRFVATNTSLKELITYAYRVRPFQLEGAPSWTDTERYDINAKAEEELQSPTGGTEAEPSRVLLMVRSLLAERFTLAIRTETREMSRYALVLVRPDRTGPQLKPSTLDCVAIRAERAEASRAAGANAVPLPPPAPGNVLPCASGSTRGYHFGRGMALTSLVGSLSRVLGRTSSTKPDLLGRSTGRWNIRPICSPRRRRTARPPRRTIVPRSRRRFRNSSD